MFFFYHVAFILKLDIIFNKKKGQREREREREREKEVGQ